MANTTLTIIWNNGSPQFDPPNPGPTELNDGDSVTVQLSGFPATGSIDSVTIFSDANKSNQVCQWTRGGSGTCPYYSIGATSETVVVITDIEDPTAPEDFWFSAAGMPDGWSVDPELINDPQG